MRARRSKGEDDERGGEERASVSVALFFVSVCMVDICGESSLGLFL